MLLVIVSTVLLLFGRYLGEVIFEYLGSPEEFIRIWDFLRYQFSVLIILLFFTILYTTIPNRKQRISEIFPGAAFATISWLMLSFVFSIFMNRFFKFASIYGGIAGIILLIIWLFWAMHILLIGAVINSANATWGHLRGAKETKPANK